MNFLQKSPHFEEGGELANVDVIATDDLGSESDICKLASEIAARPFPVAPLESLETAAHWLGNVDFREFMRRGFFERHLNQYSKSRRKAPIYWQLATTSARYSVWLYIHAFTTDTLFKIQNEYVSPKLAHEERRLESVRRDLGENVKAADRKVLAALESFVDELRAFLNELKRVAPLWNPNLHDGVIINFAPLWRLVPHYKPWQKELKATWDLLCAGEIDCPTSRCICGPSGSYPNVRSTGRSPPPTVSKAFSGSRTPMGTGSRSGPLPGLWKKSSPNGVRRR